MSDYSSEQLEAVQNAVDRVTSWQDGATEGTVDKELRDALNEVGVDLSEGEITTLAEAIQDEHGAIDATSLLQSDRA